MNKKIVIALALIVLLVGVGWFLTKGGEGKKTETVKVVPREAGEAVIVVEPATQSSQMLESEKVQVKYTDDGFMPRSVTIKAGTVVTFVNGSAGKMQITPVVQVGQDKLLGFSQFLATEKGSTFTFTFSKVGEWAYVNKAVSSHTGIIVVK